jgi:succinoglycan biosynthesis transport protein ExoP
MREIPEGQTTKAVRSDLPQYFRTLWRKKYFVLIPTILAGVVAAVGVFLVAPVYESSSVILMENPRYLGDEMNRLVTVPGQRTADRPMTDKDVLAQTDAQIRSPVFLDQLIEKLDVEDNPALVAKAREKRATLHPNMSVDELVRNDLRETLDGKIRVAISGPGMFRISCFDSDPEASYLLATTVTHLFIESKRLKYLRGLRGASEFTAEQLSIYKSRLEQLELDADKIRNRITELALRQNPVGEATREYSAVFGGESNLRLAETLKDQLGVRVREVEDIVSRTEVRLAEAIGYVPAGSGIRDSADIQKLRDALVTHRETELLLELRATGVTAEDLTKKREEIREAENTLQRRLVELVDLQFSDVSREYRPLIVEYYYQMALWRSLQAKLAKLNQYISGFKEQLNVVPLLDTELAKVENEIKTNQEIYNSLLKAKTSAQVSEAAQATGLAETIDVLEWPVKPMVPVKPKKSAVVLLALIFGAGLGVAGLVVSEYTDTSFRTVEEIEARLGLRVLGTIPLIEMTSEWNRAARKKQALVWLVTSVIVVVVSLAGFYYYGKVANRQAKHVTTQSTGQE